MKQHYYNNNKYSIYNIMYSIFTSNYIKYFEYFKSINSKIKNYAPIYTNTICEVMLKILFGIATLNHNNYYYHYLTILLVQTT